MDSLSQGKRRDPRVKVLSMTVRYRSATIADFIENHSYDVSRGGMFIKTVLPFPAGTLLKFEVRIAGEQKVMQGVGRVVWKRDQSGGQGASPAGMGVKFIKLDDDSRGVIDKVVAVQKGARAAFEEGADAAGLSLDSLESLAPSSLDEAALASLDSPASVSGQSVPVSERSRTGTMLGLGSSPPSGPSVSAPGNGFGSAPPPVEGFVPLGEVDESEPEEATMVRQADRLLRTALEMAGGDGAAPTEPAPSQTRLGAERPPESEDAGADDEPTPAFHRAAPLQATEAALSEGAGQVEEAQADSAGASTRTGAGGEARVLKPPPRRGKAASKTKKAKKRRTSVPPRAASPSAPASAAVAKTTPPTKWQHGPAPDASSTAKGVAWLVVAAAAAGGVVYWSKGPAELAPARLHSEPAAHVATPAAVRASATPKPPATAESAEPQASAAEVSAADEPVDESAGDTPTEQATQEPIAAEPVVDAKPAAAPERAARVAPAPVSKPAAPPPAPAAVKPQPAPAAAPPAPVTPAASKSTSSAPQPPPSEVAQPPATKPPSASSAPTQAPATSPPDDAKPTPKPNESVEAKPPPTPPAEPPKSTPAPTGGSDDNPY